MLNVTVVYTRRFQLNSVNHSMNASSPPTNFYFYSHKHFVSHSMVIHLIQDIKHFFTDWK